MTKKIFKIILSLIIISTMNIISIGNANAADPLEELLVALDDVVPCVDEGPGGTDEGKIYTFIEEPLSSGEEKVNGTVVSRPCFRNTFQYTDSGGKNHTLSLVGKTECSANGQRLVSEPAMSEYKPKFSCKEVQALICTGGTCLIYAYIAMIYRWGASIVGIIAVLVIVLSGIQLSAAGGDTEAVGKAKTRILQSIAGIVVLFLSGLILYTINPNFFVP